MMSEHFITVNTGQISLGWKELVSALEDFIEELPEKDIRAQHVRRLEAITDAMEAKRLQHVEHTRVGA